MDEALGKAREKAKVVCLSDNKTVKFGCVVSSIL